METKPKPDDIIKMAAEMRRHQKAFFKTRDASELRKSKELENQLDAMLESYFGNDAKQTDNQLKMF